MEQTSAEETTLNPTYDWRLQGLVVQSQGCRWLR